MANGGVIPANTVGTVLSLTYFRGKQYCNVEWLALDQDGHKHICSWPATLLDPANAIDFLCLKKERHLLTLAPAVTYNAFMAKRRFKKVLREIDPAKFKKLRGSPEKQLDIACWNLWGQFGITKEVAERRKKNGRPVDVMHYAWTQQARDDFYSYHSKVKNIIKKKGLWTWALNVEPVDYELALEMRKCPPL